jgi:hypothetical protein
MTPSERHFFRLKSTKRRWSVFHRLGYRAIFSPSSCAWTPAFVGLRLELEREIHRGSTKP